MIGKRKSIVFFSDLEGTLLDENGNFDDENFYNFLVELSKLGETLKADVKLAIVSPMGPVYMTKILKQMDSRIRILHRNQTNPQYSVDVTSAAADFNDLSADSTEKIDRRIDILTIANRRTGSLGNEAKSNYVNSYIETKENPKYDDEKDVVLYIYAGNGDNDLSAMKTINNLKNGITICPANTTQITKIIARMHSGYDSVKGIGDCIRQIREKIEERKEASTDEQPKKEASEEVK